MAGSAHPLVGCPRSRAVLEGCAILSKDIESQARARARKVSEAGRPGREARAQCARRGRHGHSTKNGREQCLNAPAMRYERVSLEEQKRVHVERGPSHAHNELVEASLQRLDLHDSPSQSCGPIGATKSGGYGVADCGSSAFLMTVDMVDRVIHNTYIT